MSKQQFRVQMPDTQTPERWKRGRVVEVKTDAEVAELVAQGGKLIEDTEGTEDTAPARHAPDAVTTTGAAGPTPGKGGSARR